MLDKIRKCGRNIITLLVARSSNEKFSRTGNFKKTIGSSIGEWTLLVPLPFNPDGEEQWVATNNFGEFSLCVIDSKEDMVDCILIENISHFLKDVKPHLAHLRAKLPKLFTMEMFESIAKEYGAKKVYQENGTGFANWEGFQEDCRVSICFGRILEMLPNPNEAVARKNCITISNLKEIED